MKKSDRSDMHGLYILKGWTINFCRAFPIAVPSLMPPSPGIQMEDKLTPVDIWLRSTYCRPSKPAEPRQRKARQCMILPGFVN